MTATLPVPRTFWQLVVDAADERPDALVACDDHGRSLTRAELRDRAEAVAAALAERGVGPRSVVSWQLPTVLETLVLLAALARLGAVQNPLIPLLREREVGFITRQVGTTLLVVPPVWRGFDHGALARDLAAEVGFDVLEVDLADLDGRGPGLRLPEGDPAELPPPPADDAVRWIYYSSGTTAAPKGARHTDFTIMHAAAALIELAGFGDGDTYPIPWPTTHIGGSSMLTVSLRTGMQMLLLDEFHPQVTPQRLIPFRPTALGTAVPMFRAYLDAQAASPEPLYPALRFAAFGGAPVPAEIHDEMQAVFGVTLVGAWGLTEFPNATSATIHDSFDVVTTSVGRPVEGVSVRAVKDDGTECGVGEEGELRLKGPQCFAGYVDSALDADAFDADGWFRTGDLGTIDAEGNVRITGRIKDIVIRNAENISVVEIEELLFRHPSVADAAVIGLPDPRTGERVVAVVVLREGQGLELTDLREHCRTSGLAIQKCPEQLEVVDALPRNSMGKVLKQDLRAALLPKG